MMLTMKCSENRAKGQLDVVVLEETSAEKARMSEQLRTIIPQPLIFGRGWHCWGMACLSVIIAASLL